MMRITLREIVEADIPALFRFQADPESNQLAGVKPRDEAAFRALWAEVARNPDITPRAILADDTLVGHITCFPHFLGNQTSRPFGVMLINRNIQGTDGPAGVYFQLGNLSVFENPNWTSYSVTIANPASATTPAGWIGFGSTNAQFEPQLPTGTTFADILANVTEFRISGAVPGFFFGPVMPDYYMDNISVTVPAPGAAIPMLGIAAAACARRRR